MDSPVIVGVIAGTVFLMTLAVTPGVIAGLQRSGVMDVPNHRSSHTHVTVRGVGLGLAVVVSLTTIAVGSPLARWIAGPALLLGALGFADDVRGLPVAVRLPVQAAVAVGVALGSVFVLGASPYWLLLAPVWIVGYLNAFNFMDGINGISSVHAGTVGLAWAVASGLAGDMTGLLIGLVLLAGTAAFLPFNFPNARAFLGDAGSYFLGGWIAIGAVLLSGRIGLVPALLPAIVYVADTSWTLVRRVCAGERWSEPHRDHVYQQLVRGGWTHARTTGLVGLVTLVTGALAVWASVRPDATTQFVAMGLGLAIGAIYLALPHVVFDRSPGPVRQEVRT